MTEVYTTDRLADLDRRIAELRHRVSMARHGSRAWEMFALLLAGALMEKEAAEVAELAG